MQTNAEQRRPDRFRILTKRVHDWRSAITPEPNARLSSYAEASTPIRRIPRLPDGLPEPVLRSQLLGWLHTRADSVSSSVYRPGQAYYRIAARMASQ